MSSKNCLHESSGCGSLDERDKIDMKAITASEFKNHLGQHIAALRDEPLIVQKSGHPIAVVLSPVEFEYLREMEDLYWIARGQAAASSLWRHTGWKPMPR